MCSRSAARASASVDAGRRERAVPVDVPVVDRGLVELGVELHAPRALADAEALARAGGRTQQLDRAGRQREAVLVPVHAGGAGRQRAEHRVAGCGRQRLELEPVEVASRQLADLAAVRMREQLAPRQTPSTGTPARRGVAQQRGLRRERRVGGGLLAAEDEDPVGLAWRGQRIALAQEALVERDAGVAQRGPGVAEELAPEVVQDGDAGRAWRRC